MGIGGAVAEDHVRAVGPPPLDVTLIVPISTQGLDRLSGLLIMPVQVPFITGHVLIGAAVILKRVVGQLSTQFRCLAFEVVTSGLCYLFWSGSVGQSWRSLKPGSKRMRF